MVDPSDHNRAAGQRGDARSARPELAAASRGRARREIPSGAVPADLPPSQSRRLTAAERQKLRDRRRATMQPASPAPLPESPLPKPSQPKPPPRMPRPAETQTGSSRGLVVLGAVLIAGLSVLAVAGGRLFGEATTSDPRMPTVAADDAPLMAVATPGAPTPSLQAGSGQIGIATAETLADFPGDRPPVVCLDPGHGGPDTGFQRVGNADAPSLNESILVLQHAWDLEARLQLRGYTVVMTRDDDRAVNVDNRDVNGDGKTAKDDRRGNFQYRNLDELQARIDICNNAKADILVSMHVNGYSNGDPRGYETWYTRERVFGDQNERFASLVYLQLKEQLSTIDYIQPEQERGVLPDTTANVDTEHAKFKHFVVLGPEVPGQVKPSMMPGAIVETLFVSNDYDAQFLASPAGRAAIVTAYENAITQYFEEYPPD
ncbi:MAG: N-acetylmuramoyl-L-alanine amidase [Chloroflexota bacterium]|nr:N-acetylmuramoyl-L-alanine amidase [Chloroflexota bacterium]